MFANCSYKITRTGYLTNSSNFKNCDIVIKRNIHISDTLATKIGEIKLGDSGFSVNCSEITALEILNKEACSLNADLIIIKEETRPDLWSSCYRCRADFYKYNNSEKINTEKKDSNYNNQNLQLRNKEDKSRNTTTFFISLLIGFILAISLK